ncbi:hypothetical protein ACEQPO_09255 [Bacillus sp. SL00103]
MKRERSCFKAIYQVLQIRQKGAYHTRCPHAKQICQKEIPAFQELKPNHFVARHLTTLNRFV